MRTGRSLRRTPLLAAGWLAVALAGWGAAPARAESPEPLCAPVPEAIAAFQASEAERSRAALAIARLRLPAAHISPGTRASGRAWLLLLEGAGLKAVAEHLASGAAQAPELPHLLQVAAESPLAEAELLLARAARSPRYDLRMIAADGLGRGRTPAAEALLGALARDPVPGVRLAALRSLFAIETPAAAALRQDLALDVLESVMTARLRWHRRVGEYPGPVVAYATALFRRAPDTPAGLEAALYLSHAGPRTPAAVLEEVLAGTLDTAPAAARHRPSGRALTRRRAAVEAILGLLDHPELAPTRRPGLLGLGLDAIAHPVPMDPMGRDPIPEHRLRQRLPDFGALLVDPVCQRLLSGAFADPRAGLILLRELGVELGLPAVHGLLRATAPSAPVGAQPHAPWIRAAAVGTLRDFGRVGDLDLARDLLAGVDPVSVKIDVVLALEGEPDAQAVTLLCGLLPHPDNALRSYALDVLERRAEPTARAALVADLFEHAERPHDRLAALVAQNGVDAVALVARALEDPRPLLREAALAQFERQPALRTPAARALLDAFAPRARAPLEVQGVLRALLVLDPPAGVAFVRERWDAFATDSIRLTCLRQLQDARGPAGPQAVDFALERLARAPGRRMDHEVATVLSGRWGHRDAEIEAFWRRLLAGEDPDLRRNAVQALRHPNAPDFTAELLALLEGTVPLARADAAAREQALGLIETLAYHDWTRVEPAFTRLAKDPEVEPAVRAHAAERLIGRLSEPTRWDLMRWLRYAPTAPDEAAPAVGVEEHELRVYLAAAVGEGAGPDVAAVLLEALTREFEPLLAEDWAFPSAPGQAVATRARTERVMALVRGIAHTRDPTTILSLVSMLLDPRLGVQSRRVLHEAGLGSAAPTADAAGRVPARLAVRAQCDERGAVHFLGIPVGVYEMFSPLRVLGDETLAAAFERALRDARAPGALFLFPDLYLMRLALALRHEATGAMPRTAEAVGRAMRPLSPIEGPHDYQVLRREVDQATLEGRWEEAAAGQEALVRIVARQAADDAEPGTWTHERATLDAIRAARAQARGEEAVALDLLQQGLARAGSDPGVLNVVAWYAALGRVGLPLVEAAARRAVQLEVRVGDRPARHTADTLAYVLLLRGQPAEGYAVLAPRLATGRLTPDGSGVLHWHLAQILEALGRRGEAAAALVEALTWDRALRPLLERDPFLARLVGDAALWARIQERARAARKEERLE